MSRIRKLLGSVRIWILLACIVMFLIALNPNPFADGVVIKGVSKDSAAALAGIQNPLSNARPTGLEQIVSINGKAIGTLDDFYTVTQGLPANRTIQVTTDRGTYRLSTKPILETIALNETETVTVPTTVLVNTTVNGTVTQVPTQVNTTVKQPKTSTKVIGVEPLGITVGPAATTNIRKGLDLQGGTRVLLAPEETVTDEMLATMVDSLKQRLNVFGLSDILVSPVTDFSGGKFILVELAGATESQARDLLSKQGKFEAKIGNETVFKGGEDITYVCRTAECSGIDPNRGCLPSPAGGYTCGYFFSISLSPGAARHHADVTRNIDVEGVPPEDYLVQNLSLFLDDSLVRQLRIGSSLKGMETTEVQISGFGSGVTQQDAIQTTLDDMKQLQTVLVTGSLPAKIKIVRADTISPTLGETFTYNALIMGALSILAVVIVLLISYRRLALAIPIMITSLVEVFLVLGSYALFGWSLDLAAIAGIIIAVGTGVNDQIVITDETLQKETGTQVRGWAERIKRAFSIIMASYFTLSVAMLPLLFAGAGLLRGFAITTIVGISFGVFVTRPAYGKLVEVLLDR